MHFACSKGINQPPSQCGGEPNNPSGNVLKKRIIVVLKKVIKLCTVTDLWCKDFLAILWNH
jgi:hypothetical protein